MEQREQMTTGIAAIALAALFPVYWIFSLSDAMGDFEASIRANLTVLNFNDLLFLVLGILEIYVYLSLRKTLKDYMGTTAAQLLLLLMCIAVIAFHSTLIFDLFLAMAQAPSAETIDNLNNIAIAISIGGLIIYSILGLVFAILLMLKAKELSSLIKVFSVLLLISCALQLTVVFSFVSLLLFPAAMLVLAIYYFKSPTSVEVV
ncbi:hypothetical protein [Planctobacterium marinum]|uniref:Uncharacterized protein n=1 Tax=Planctobacterium marinum TaxID=1631968 RepID=A0AA48HL08_9ALTE|nr:hypothetical protein MACH26_27000 [Planctobacterium marinum]